MIHVEKRRALRLVLDAPVSVRSVGQARLTLHPSLERVYERVHPAQDRCGDRFAAALRDLSTNGAFIAGDALPLLSRVALRFSLEQLDIEAIGWTLWRRSSDCIISRDSSAPLSLPRGFGVLFESIPLEARLLITRLVDQAPRAPSAD
jgi:hypothetical protein